MSEKVIGSVQKLLASDRDIKASVVRGSLYARDDSEALSLRYTKNGDAMTIGTLRCVQKFGERTSTYFVNFTAFGDIAESMIGLQSDDKLVMITDRQRRKGKNGKWYENDVVLYYEKV